MPVVSPTLTPQDFVAKWRKAALKESAAVADRPLQPAPGLAELAYKKLDVAVFAAYGWPADLTDEEILERLLALNLARAGVDPGS